MSLADFKAKYPLIYTHCHPCGGPGWVALLEVLLEQLQVRADSGGVQARALLTREKWGRLSLRFLPLDPADEAMVAYVEKLSMHICEVCGAPGTLIPEPWYRTRCDAHTEARPTWPMSAR